MPVAIFPGSFDPLTKAHVNILNRALPLFSKVIVGIGRNSSKQSLLSIEQRKLIIEKVYEKEPKVEVLSYDTLTVNFCKAVGAKYMIRGIRTVSDFEYEKAIAQMNHALEPDIESIFIISKPGYSAISSTIVRDILRYGGDISQFVPLEALQFI
jgi:pantetheine-phosphate adenylyltransferase